MYTKFGVGDKVIVKETEKLGEVKSYKIEGFYHNGKLVETIKYYVYTDPYHTWIDEKDLAYEYDFSPKFEINLINLLIDFNLDKKDFNMVKQLNELRQQYIKKIKR